MKRWWLVAVGMLCGSVHAQSVNAPALKAGDSWVYADTVETGPQGWSRKNIAVTVERVDGDSMLVSDRQEGSTQPAVERLVGLDWSRSRDINGKQQVVNRPMVFPLTPGKKWHVEYTEANPNRQHSSETVGDDYSVVGWEEVQVPAGTFKAVKIEAQGQWTAIVAPSVATDSHGQVDANGALSVSQSQITRPRTVSGRLYKAFWYVPEQKRFVKSVEEYYNSKGVRSSRYTEELQSSKLAG
ncbi:hypothetical protein [Dyella terrae]|uniref:hypothetical protein n=1 Tax=Dyella terrae TaxID=522259 RepID=UPI001EFE4EFF|nr:hypothetical protein [Dyella terrae]ULU26903.1 hypothetical protein DYST_03853 [Dyella terrae]